MLRRFRNCLEKVVNLEIVKSIPFEPSLVVTYKWNEKVKGKCTQKR